MRTKLTIAPELMLMRELEGVSGLQRLTLIRYIHRGLIPVTKVGKAYAVSRDWVADHLEAMQSGDLGGRPAMIKRKLAQRQAKPAKPRKTGRYARGEISLEEAGRLLGRTRQRVSQWQQRTRHREPLLPKPLTRAAVLALAEKLQKETGGGDISV